MTVTVSSLMTSERVAESSMNLKRNKLPDMLNEIGLSLGLLLVSDSCLRSAERGARMAFTILAVLLLVCVAAILCSAIWRMRLYVTRFGWTEQRLFASVFLLWTAFALPWFGATALAGFASRFTSGVLAAGAVLVIALHAISPERVIVASHLDRAHTARAEIVPVDYDYLLQLGVGAVEPLVDRFDELPEEVRTRALELWEGEFADDRPALAGTFVRARAEVAAARARAKEW